MRLQFAAASLVAAILLLNARRKRRRPPATDLPLLRVLDKVPEQLLTSFYMDLDAAESRGCEHAAYLRGTDVASALDGLHAYVTALLQQIERPGEWRSARSPNIERGTPANMQPERCLEGTGRLLTGPGASVDGGTFDLRDGSIFVGAGSVVEPGAFIRGPAYIGDHCVVRHGAYVRGDVAIGSHCVVGGELKNMLALDECDCPHHGYIGDSLLGHKAHFGCGALTANLPLFPKSRPSVEVKGGAYVALGRRKFGAVVGAHCQLGCGSVTEPGCLLAPRTHSYPLSRLPRGCWGPNVVLKNRPVLEQAPLRA